MARPSLPLSPEALKRIRRETERYGLGFTDHQINRLVREFGLLRRCREAFDSYERDVFMEGLARKFTGCQWPLNDENINKWIEREHGIPAHSNPEQFPDDLVAGWRRYQARAKK